jgi:hypothetical protein
MIHKQQQLKVNMEQLAMIDDGASSIGKAPSQESWDDLEDLIEKI